MSHMNVGYHERSVHDDYTLAVDFGPCGVFDDDPVTSAAVASDDATLIVSATADVSDENVAAFRVYGGTADATATVTVTATNANGDDVCRSVTVHTRSC